MLDHLHFLTEGLDDDSDLRRFIHDFKHRSGYEYRRATRNSLWQVGYYDHVVRQNETAKRIAAYIIQNPVRAGLVTDSRQYPFLGSDAYSLDDLLGEVTWESGA